MKNLPEKSVKLVYGSPPYPNARRNYGVWKTEDYVEKISPFFDSIKYILRDDGFFVLNIKANRNPGTSNTSSERSLIVEKIMLMLKEKWKMYCVDIEIWVKKSWAPTGLKCACQDVYEYMLWYSISPKWKINLDAIRTPYSPATLNSYKEKTWNPLHNGLAYFCKTKKIEPNPLGALPRNVIIGANAQNRENHQAVQPLYLPEKYIKATTKEGDIVCDPWVGTATTGVSALRLGRKFIGFDVCQEYIEIGKRRLEEVLKEKDKA